MTLHVDGNLQLAPGLVSFIAQVVTTTTCEVTKCHTRMNGAIHIVHDAKLRNEQHVTIPPSPFVHHAKLRSDSHISNEDPLQDNLASRVS